MNFNDDAGDRLIQLLTDHEVAFRANLAGAARMAGQQLEFLKPSVFGAGRAGFVAGPAAHVNRGTILIVLANARRVFTFHLLALPAGLSRIEMLDDMVAFAIGELGKPWAGDHTLLLIRHILKDLGGLPGEPGPQLAPQRIGGIIGGLLAAIPDAARHDMFAGIEAVVREDVCPAMVGLIGPATSGRAGKSSGVWPLLMPLARYIERVVDVADGEMPA